VTVYESILDRKTVLCQHNLSLGVLDEEKLAVELQGSVSLPSAEEWSADSRIEDKFFMKMHDGMLDCYAHFI